jgi:trans-2,3-dihydro-3-hydroxyanthranilate isomerase
MALTFYMVDVFAEAKYAGNQLAVFVDAGHLSGEQMQQIAKEINFSETTFVLSAAIASPEFNQGGYPVRIFTPTRELPFAGHPTLGTAFVLQQTVIQQAVERVILNLQVGQIPVTIAYHNGAPDLLWMRQNPPTFGAVVAGDRVAPVLNLDLEDFDQRFPIQEVSTGMPFLVVPLKTLAALQRIQVNEAALRSLVNSFSAKDIFVFCPETRSPQNQFSARMFAPCSGIAEDPATGSANGCFAGYLVQHNYLGADLGTDLGTAIAGSASVEMSVEMSVEVSVEQGYEMGRPSRLLLKAKREGESIEVLVGGSVILIARGEFL